MLKVVRTVFAACGGEESPPENPKDGGVAPIKTAKEPDEKHRLEPYLILRKENF